MSGRCLARGCAIIAVAVTSACDEPPTPAQVFPSVAAFRSLGEVRLGLTVDQLQKHRPHVIYAPHVGAREVIGDTIYYGYEGALTDAVPRPGEKLPIGSLNPMRSIVSPAWTTWREEADTLFADRVRDLARLGAVRCVDYLPAVRGFPKEYVSLEARLDGDGVRYLARIVGPIFRRQSAAQRQPEQWWLVSAHITNEPVRPMPDEFRIRDRECPK